MATGCLDQLRKYVQWAAQEHQHAPERYLLGIGLTSVGVDGSAAIIDGKVDINLTQVDAARGRFNFQLYGAGRRHVITEAGDEAAPGTKVLLWIDADERRVRVHIGDPAAREVLDAFTLACRGAIMAGFSAERAYLLTLKRLEFVSDAWVALEDAVSDPPQVAAAGGQTPGGAADAAAVAPDDLTRLGGITPKIAAGLAGLGVTRYVQLASADLETIGRGLREAGLILPPGALLSWPAQAALAAAGRWETLRYLQAQVPKWAEAAAGDDLERLTGIGPVIAARLQALGVTSFRALAEADSEQLEDALRTIGVRVPFGAAANWAEEAALAADGQWEALNQLKRAESSFRDKLRGAADPTSR